MLRQGLSPCIPDTEYDVACWQVDTAVMLKTVTVLHNPCIVGADTLVAALNAARLDASLQAPRQQTTTRYSWIPPWNGADPQVGVFIDCVIGIS